MNTKHIGDISEAALVVYFLKKGFAVSMSVGENQRYDMIIDDGTLKRIQCKTAKLKEGVLITTVGRVERGDDGKPKKVKYTRKEIDGFGIYSPDLDSCYLYLLEDEEIPPGTINLRIDAPKNGHTKHIRWAKDYEV